MGKNTKIAWCTHTWNPWWGCRKLTERRGCDHCYAESFARRVGAHVWELDAPRRVSTPMVWADPYKWDRKAEASGTRASVFCMSMGDLFEARADLDPLRTRAWKVIAETPHLDWLLLTKRIRNVETFSPWAPGAFPSNVRIGITVEDQATADRDIPVLLYLKCCNFLSVEPLLEDIGLSLLGTLPLPGYQMVYDLLNWVIVGCESGPKRRACPTPWVRNIVQQCRVAGVPVFVKQLDINGKCSRNPEEWPEDLRVQEMP